MNINILLQAISNKTDIAIEYSCKDKFQINHQVIHMTDSLLKFGDTSLRIEDPLFLLIELRKQGIFKIDDQAINEILKAYHKLQR